MGVLCKFSDQIWVNYGYFYSSETSVLRKQDISYTLNISEHMITGDKTNDLDVVKNLLLLYKLLTDS